VEKLPYLGEGNGVAVLALVSATGGNLDAETLLDKRTFAVTKLYVEYHERARPLPPHDLIFNAISDADVAMNALKSLPDLIAASDAPLINSPHAVMPTGRADIASRLGRLRNVVAAKTELVQRAVLERDGADCLRAHGFAFPLLLRLTQQHTGRHFVKVDRAEDLGASLAQLPGDEFFAIEYLDARGPDGLSRKYRVMFVDGQLYPLHLAVSPNWKIHYFSADMTENAENRAEDEAFLRDMPAAIGTTAMDALHDICTELALDYAGIDFAVNARGELLLFEANATMVIAAPGADPRWDYRRAPTHAILDAVRQMLLKRAGKSAVPG
jgi:glutathione synthase/RimK-type ligase-like ATP-grasp enzyme